MEIVSRRPVIAENYQAPKSIRTKRKEQALIGDLLNLDASVLTPEQHELFTEAAEIMAATHIQRHGQWMYKRSRDLQIDLDRRI